jgi:soluble lytic murein transglycosylase
MNFINKRLFFIKLILYVFIFLLIIDPELKASSPVNCDLIINEKLQSHSVSQIYKLGYCNVKNENYSDGVKLLESIKAKIPLLSDYILYYQAFSYQELGNDDKAIKLYNELLIKYPNSTLINRAREKLAGIYLQYKEFSKAEKLFQALLNKEKNKNKKAEYLYNIAVSQQGQDLPQDAINNFKKVWVEYPNSKYSKLSYLQALKIEKLQKVPFKITPNDYFNRAQRFFASSSWSSALKNYRKSAQTQVVLVNSAVCYFRLGNFKKALEILDGINSSESLYWQAQIRAKQNLNVLASKINIQLSKNHPKSHLAPEALYNAAKLYEIDKKLDDAIKIYEDLIKKYPRTEFAEDASWNLGWIYYKKNEFKKAHNTFSRFINSGSSFNSTRSQYWSARTLEKLGNEQQANLIYKRLSSRFFPSYYPFLAQIKSSHNDKSKIKYEALEISKSNTESKAKAELLLEFGILEDALLEIKYLHKSAKSISDYIDLSILYGKSNDFYNAIKVVQGINHPDAFRLSYPQGYREIVNKYSDLYGVDKNIIYSIMREESRYQKDVVSPAKAIGLMQLIPDTGRKTAKELGINDYSKKKLYDPETNIRLGSYYFKKVLDEFDGNVFFALGGYNAGPHRIYEWQKRFPGLNIDEFVEEIPFRETRNYIRRVLRSYGAYKSIYGEDKIM